MKALEDLSMQYDRTVRNSEQIVVQFSYGDDGLNPEVMEKQDRPVDFYRLTGVVLLHIQYVNHRFHRHHYHHHHQQLS